MGGFFRIDGPFYKFGNILYYLVVTNFLWVIFSLPIFTIGASTTALFYVMGKIIRDEDVSALRDFWKSFKLNFKQATLVWFILAFISLILYINIKSINLLGSMAKYFFPFQIAILIELIIIMIYIFPLLSRYELKTKDLFKVSIFLGNRHIFTSIICMLLVVTIYMLFLKFTGLFILLFISLYALASYSVIYRLFKKYIPQEADNKEDEEKDGE